MIHHVSLPAREPQRVAGVLAELMGGTVLPFAGARGFLVAPDDGFGTAIEVVADTLMLRPGDGDRPLQLTHLDAPSDAEAHPFHLLLSVPAERGAIEAVGAREGWRTRHSWRGSEGRRDFELIELWLENRLLVELLTPGMVPTYVAHLRAASLSLRG